MLAGAAQIMRYTQWAAISATAISIALLRLGIIQWCADGIAGVLRAVGWVAGVAFCLNAAAIIILRAAAFRKPHTQINACPFYEAGSVKR